MSLSPTMVDEERRFIRRGIALVAAAAIVTIPLAARSQALGGRRWTLVVNALVLATVVLGARRGRIPLPRLVTGAALVIYGVALLSFNSRLGDALAGRGAGGGLGSSVLWAAAVLSPATFLLLGRHRALALNVGAISAFVLLTAVRGGQAWTVALHGGAVAAMGAAAVCLGVSGLVTELAMRRGRQERVAVAGAAVATRRAEALTDAQEARRAAFEASAQALRRLVARLGTQVAEFTAVRPVDPGAPGTSAELGRLAETLAALRVQAEQTLQRPAPVPGPVPTPVRRKRDHATGPTPAVGRRAALVRGAAVAAMLVATVVDAWFLAATLRGAPSSADVAEAANRLVLVLVVTAGVSVVLLPRTQAAVASSIACLVAPALVVATVDRDLVLRPEALGWLVPSWRVAVLSVSLLLFLATLIQRREQSRDLAVERQAAANEQSREVLAAVSGQHQASQEAVHELKTPLTVLLGAVAMLRDRGPDLPSDAAEALVDSMVRGADRLSARTDLLLVAAGGAPLPDDGELPEPGVASAQAVLRAAVTAAAPVVGDRELLVDLDLDDAPVRIQVEDLEHVMENLVVNATKYGTPRRPIEVRGRVEGPDVVVTTTNEGGGLTPDDAARIFEPYFRAAGADERAPGTGLGLAVVHRLVIGWGGRVSCQVDPGTTSIRFSIPISGPPADDERRDADLVRSSGRATRS